MRSFVKEEGAVGEQVAAASAEATPAAASPPPQHAVVAVGNVYVDGEIGREDIKTPYLSCVQAVGPKSVIYRQGQIVLGETPLTQAPEPQQPTPRLRVLFCRTKKDYVQNLPYNQAPDAPRPKIYRSKAEVLAVGGTLEYQGNTPPSYIPKASLLALVRAPAGFDDPMFSIIDGEKTYTPAMVVFQKTSYGAAKTLWTDLSLSLRGDPTATFYDLFWVREQRGQNWVWVAKLQRARDEKPSDSLRARAQKLAGGTIEVIDEEGEV